MTKKLAEFGEFIQASSNAPDLSPGLNAMQSHIYGGTASQIRKISRRKHPTTTFPIYALFYFIFNYLSHICGLQSCKKN
jgi:hypothetical protein